MKRSLFLALFVITFSGFSQKLLLVNSGQFGNQSENANFNIYDLQTNVTQFTDTIQTQSAQEILIEGGFAFVAAQDSIIKYDLFNQNRTASADFPGVSTKSLALSNNILLVGNWYGQNSNNLYLFDASNLQVLDTINNVAKGAVSIHVHNQIAYISQNAQTASFTDTLGYILRLDLQTRQITDTIQVAGYSGGIGQLIPNPNGTGFYALNSSNTITSVNYSSLAATNTSINKGIRVGNRSQYSIYNDTLFFRSNSGISSLNLRNLSILDSNIVDTVVTAFDYDTMNNVFYVAQTDYFSYQLGKVFNRQGTNTASFPVGYSPEVLRVVYQTSLGLNSKHEAPQFSIYPNPANHNLNIKLPKVSLNQLLIRDMKGSLIRNYSINDLNTRLNISDLKAGVYFLSLVGENGATATKKLIVR